MTAQSKMEWVETTFWIEPRWTVEPSLECIKRLAERHLTLSPEDSVNTKIRLYSETGYSKFYAIECPRGSFVMRVTLPVDPCFKTLSETATLELVRSETTIPVPRVLAYDASSENELGFEWILTERLPGKSLGEMWDLMSWSAKCALVERIADVLAQLSRLRFKCIGNLYRSSDLEAVAPEAASEAERVGHVAADPVASLARESPGFALGRIVSMPFFWYTRLGEDVSRGPFRSTRDWLSVRLTLAMTDAMRETEYPDDAAATEEIVQRLRGNLLRFFPDEDTHYTLHQANLAEYNILVDEDGKFTGLLDWDCVSVVPTWKACQLPHFLEGSDRSTAPDPEQFIDGAEDTLYREQLQKYELTQLRPLFIRSIETAEPSWVKEYRTATAKADFELAVSECATELHLATIRQWLDAVDAGDKDCSLYQLLLI